MNEKLNKIFSLINQYYAGTVNIAGLIHNIEIHFGDFDSIDERNIYNELRNLDADLELTRFTVSKDKQKEEVKKYVEAFKSHVIRVT
jgi:hypothetical protein